MPTDIEAIRAQAAEWHVRRRDMAVADWHAFISWLEADSAHASAYDDLALLDTAFDSVIPANDLDALPAPRRYRVYGWTAIAATIAVVITTGAFLLPRHAVPERDTYAVATAAGVQRSLTLADGSLAELGGGTRLILDHRDPRYVALESGAAVFHVTHNAEHPFRLRSDGHVLEDVGTVFEVAHTRSGLEVSVSEGSIVFDPEGEKLAVAAGKRLSVDSASGQVALEALPAARIGEWRDGRLAFDDQPLAHAVARLGQVTGAQVTLAPALSQQHFTGMVRLTGSAAQDIPHFAELAGTSWTRVGDNWVIGSPRGR